MIAELECSEYETARHFFQGLEYDLLLPAMLEQNSPAQIWLDDRLKPKSVFLWDKANNVFYLSGDQRNKLFNNELGTLIRQRVVPELRTRRRLHFRIQVTSETWVPILPLIFRDICLASGTYMLFSHQKRIKSDWQTSMPSHFRIKQIDEKFLCSSLHDNKGLLLEEIRSMWPSMERFVKFGFGFSLATKRRIVSWCTAEYVSRRKCGTGIETIPEYQNRGFATITASAFVEYCIQKGIRPHWECNLDNLASRRVAEKVGFVKELEYPVHFGKFG